MTDRIEEVKKILQEYRNNIFACNSKHSLLLQDDSVAKQICKLFKQNEPQPDADRLLVVGRRSGKFEEAVSKMVSIKEAECRKKIEEIRKEIEALLHMSLERDEGSGDFYVEIKAESIDVHKWQSLWDRYLGEGG